MNLARREAQCSSKSGTGYKSQPAKMDVSFPPDTTLPQLSLPMEVTSGSTASVSDEVNGEGAARLGSHVQISHIRGETANSKERRERIGRSHRPHRVQQQRSAIQLRPEDPAAHAQRLPTASCRSPTAQRNFEGWKCFNYHPRDGGKTLQIISQPTVRFRPRNQTRAESRRGKAATRGIKGASSGSLIGVAKDWSYPKKSAHNQKPSKQEHPI
nr:uncharacterized protein LOC110363777 [Columba livia]